MNEVIVDGFGLTSAVGCLVGAAVCVLKAATLIGDDHLSILGYSVSSKWAYRLLALLMLITLESVVRHT